MKQQNKKELKDLLLLRWNNNISYLTILPIILLESKYKIIWLIGVAYPLYTDNNLDGTLAEGMAWIYVLVILLIQAMPWLYFLRTYFLGKPFQVKFL